MTRHFLPLTVLALAVLAGCSSVPKPNARLDEAHSEYRAALADPQARDLAAAELRRAADALARADAAQARRDAAPEVDHLAYLARQQTAIAQQVAQRRGAEAAVTAANTERDQLRLAARTREADAARGDAAIAERQAAVSQRQAVAARRDASASQEEATSAQRDAAASRRQAEAAQTQTALAQQQAAEAERRGAALEALLRELNAKKTDRGVVVTLGDVLFDTNRAELKPGGHRNVERLAGFLKDNPGRKVLIEGFTDSTGSQSVNQQLSGRRAEAVRAAMIEHGVSRERLAAHGYGPAFPVAGNDTSGGRQMNRRVEIIVSDEGGSITPR